MNEIICGDCADIMPGMPAESVDLIITSPPYFDAKAYGDEKDQIGNIHVFDSYISKLLEVWRQCQRVLVPNGKLVINAPSMPIAKDTFDTHHNRHIYDINSAIQHSIIHNTACTCTTPTSGPAQTRQKPSCLEAIRFQGICTRKTPSSTSLYMSRMAFQKNVVLKRRNRADCPKRSCRITPNRSGTYQSRIKETSLTGSILP